MAFGIDDALQIGGGLASGLSGIFGGGGASDAANKALDQANEQYKQSSQATTDAARRNLALQDPAYQQSWRANQAYLAALGLPYITNDPVLASMQHNADNYIAVGPDGTQTVVNSIPGYGNGTSGTSGGQGGGTNPLGVLAPGGGQNGAAANPAGLNFNAPKGTPIGTVNGTTYYSRDEDSLMPYNWAAGTGFQQTPGYQFQFDQGVQAQDRSAAARGMLMSGAQEKALTNYGQGVANQSYNQWLDRVGGVAGQGPAATGAVTGTYTGLGNASAVNAGNLANLALTSGETNATVAQNGQSSFNSGLTGLLSGLGSSNYLKNASWTQDIGSWF